MEQKASCMAVLVHDVRASKAYKACTQVVPIIPKGFGTVRDGCRDAGAVRNSVQLCVNQNSM